MSKLYRNEVGYYTLISDILKKGVEVPDRTGIGSIALFDAKVVFSKCSSITSTLRPAPLRMAFEEFWMFLRGSTNTKELEEKGINFWKGNTSREFLDNRGLHYLDSGDMGMAYGFQFRNFGGFSEAYINDQFNSEDEDLKELYRVKGIDQLEESFNILKNDKYSRRNIVTFWNPEFSDTMALTPCWHTHQLVVLPNKNGKDVLHMKLINRSLDSVFGFLFAVQQYRLYQMALCKIFDFELGELSCDLTQVHIYKNQIDYAKELLERGFPLYENAPEVKINKDMKNLDDLINLKWEDISILNNIVNKEPFKTPRPDMAV